MSGKVYLVGGGPGDPDLLTVRAARLLGQAEVILADRLGPIAALEELAPQAVIIDVKKIPRGEFTPQEVINDLLIEHASAGKMVVRLKGGDPFVFGRGMEEVLACEQAGIETEVVPGVSSSVAAPAAAGIPVTHRAVSRGFSVVSGHVPPGDPRSDIDWRALGASQTTIVMLMGVHNVVPITAELLASGRPSATPVAIIVNATLPSQLVVRTRLGDLAAGQVPQGVIAPAVVVIGEVAGDELPGTLEADVTARSASAAEELGSKPTTSQTHQEQS